MNADRALQEAYQEWRRLAEAEGEAIRAGNWMFLFDCQSALRQLQPVILRRTDEARREWDENSLNCEEKENHLNALIISLIELERRNHSLLENRRRVAEAELAKLEQAGLTLRRIQRSYTPARPTSWTSFS
ncbi:MAG TPA: hypothetical protein VMA13_12110 [Candidatus Saccharimonadales bacterium]|nr:hypothetical protein [Candidatus Saccharimonadales bacterium]